MSPGRKAFLWVFLFCFGIGLLIGLVKLVAPDAASVTLNGEQVTGMTAVFTGAGLGAGVGLFFGAIVGGITALATRGRKAA